MDIGEGDPPFRVIQNVQQHMGLDGRQSLLCHGPVASLLQLDVDLPVLLDQDGSIYFHAGSTSFQFVLPQIVWAFIFIAQKLLHVKFKSVIIY